AGGLLAAYLGRREYEVHLYERRSDPRAGNFVGGRSINLALSTRGIDSLDQLGVAGEVLRHAIPMRGRMIHDKSGDLHFAPYDRDPKNYINSIGRAALHTWPRKSFMMIALPNPDGSFTCTLFWKFEGPRSFESTRNHDDVRRFFD